MSCAPSIGLRLRSDQPLHTLKVYSGAIHPSQPFTNIPVIPTTTSYDVVKLTLSKLGINERPAEYQLAEVTTGEDVIRGERRLGVTEKPMELQNKWNSETANKFYLRRKVSNVTTTEWIHRSEDLTSLRDVFQGQREAPHDLCELSTLTEENLLESLKTRFSKDVIYTYVNTILIAVNPFKDLPIYDVDLVHKYNNKRNRSELAPHVFAVANTALRNMLETRKNQCMVISGESGSGKTETTRHIIHWLTTTQNKRSSTLGLAQSILGAGELLEAFGNAQTSRNKNSSRFGRFIQLEYRHDGSVHGAVIDKYLLEKSRITNISVKERSYHVFYYLLAGCPQQFRQEFQLKSVEQFNYLNQSACTVDGMDDAEGFVKLQRSMNMVGIIEEQQSSIFKVLSAILHLGNITFKKHNNLRTSEECVVIADKEALQTVAEMLSVRADLLQAALTTRKSFTRGEQFITHYKMFDATATRDTLAKSLYTYLFDWLLSHVNQGLVSETRTAEKYLSIGLLDIFGFEDFKTGNRFEQFCINYANEQLQHFFDQHIFKLEQAEYRSEGIRWTMIDYQDNTSCLELFHGKPIGLLHLLDEENSFPGGTDASLLQKFNDQHTSHEKFVALPLRENQFGIQHYAGGVTYNIDEFLEKNRGHMRADIVHVLKSSTSLFIKKLIGCDPVALARWALLRNYVGAVFACRNAIQSYTADPKDTAIVFRSKKRSSDSDGSRSVRDRASAYMCENQPELSSTSSSVSSETDLKLRRTSDSAMSHLNNYQSPTAIALARQNRIKFQPLRGTVRGRRQPRSTVVGQFMTSLTSLVKVLNSGSPHFIRCIKSNYSGKPEEFEDEFVLRQLRYTGMLETIQIRKASYSVRFNIEEFCTQFRLLMRESGSRDVATFFEWMKLDRRQYQIGTNKVFMRDGPLQVLNEYQDRLILQRVTMIQRKVRAWFWRRKFLQMRAAALLIQRRWREYSARERAAAITLIASVWRMYRVRKSFLQQREAAIKIQRGWRNYKNIELPPPAPTPTRYSELLLGDSPILSNNQNQWVRDTLTTDIMNSFSFLDSFEDDEQTRSNSVCRAITPSVTPDGARPATTSPVVCPLSPMLDPITTHGRAFLLPAKVKSNLDQLEQEMPEEFHIQTQDTDEKNIQNPSSWQGAEQPSLIRGGPARTPYTRSQSVTNAPPTLVRSSSGYPNTWTDMQTTSFKFLREKEEQDTYAHFHSKSSRKRRSVKSIKKDDNRLSKSLEHIDCIELNDMMPTEMAPPTVYRHSNQSSALPTLTHIFKSVIAPRGSVCNLCGKKLQARIFARATQCQASTCHKIYHRHCQSKAGHCVPTFTQPKRVLANNLGEIQMLDKFIQTKIQETSQYCEKISHDKGTNKLFVNVLKEFQQYLTRTQAALCMNTSDSDNSLYTLYHEECTTIFEHCLTKFTKTTILTGDTRHAQQRDAAAIKAMFDSILENFMYFKHEASFKDDARKSMITSTTVREQQTLTRAYKAGIVEHKSHRLVCTHYGVMMTCVQCKKRINILEKCRHCQDCKAVYHQKCYKNVTDPCQGVAVASAQPKPFFGTLLHELTAGEGPNVLIPRNLEKIMLVLEQQGLYTVGLYRVSANANQMKLLKSKLLVNTPELSVQGIIPHTLAAMVKMFFRELPEPVLSYVLYDDFLRASTFEGNTRNKALYDLIQKLPRTNFNVFERLIYHLAQVAQQELTNKMNPSSLAMIFAPSLLRPEKEPSPMQALEDIKRRTMVIQSIIEVQMGYLDKKLKTIKTLNDADQTPEIVEQKTELTVGLSQFVQWDDIASDNEPEAVQSLEAPINLSATSSESSLLHPTKSRPKRPTRRHSTNSPPATPLISEDSATPPAPKSIADGVRTKKKNSKGRNKGNRNYRGPYATNHT